MTCDVAFDHVVILAKLPTNSEPVVIPLKLPVAHPNAADINPEITAEFKLTNRDGLGIRSGFELYRGDGRGAEGVGRADAMKDESSDRSRKIAEEIKQRFENSNGE